MENNRIVYITYPTLKYSFTIQQFNFVSQLEHELVARGNKNFANFLETVYEFTTRNRELVDNGEFYESINCIICCNVSLVWLDDTIFEQFHKDC